MSQRRTSTFAAAPLASLLSAGMLVMGIMLACFSARAGTLDPVLPRITAQVQAQLRYPPKAIALQQSGRAVVRFRIDRSGKILEVGLVSKTGSAPLDVEAINVFNRIVRFDLGIGDDFVPEAKSFVIQLPITFDLSNQSAQPGAPTEGASLPAAGP